LFRKLVKAKELVTKNKIRENQKSNCVALLIPVFSSVLVLAHFASSFFPGARLWGINHLAYFPVEVRILLALIFLVFLIPEINSKILNFLKIFFDTIHAVTLGKARRLWFVFLPVISFFLFWIFRTRTHFLGDSYQIISSLEKGEFYVKWAELGEGFFHIYLYKLLNPIFNINAETVYELSSCFFGAIFVFLVLLMVDFLGEDKGEKLFLFLFMMFMGSIQLFCGYAEHYSLSYTLIFGFIIFSVKYLKGQGKPFFPLLFFAIALFSHISAFYLLPSVFLLYLLGYQREKKSSFFEKMEVWAILYLILIAVLIFLHMKRYSWTVGNKFVPLLEGDYYAPGYSLFSLSHILDIVNQQLLISPVGLILLVIIGACSKAFNFKDKSVPFLSSMLLLGLGFNLIMYPGLGMSRDWDMFSSTGVGYTVLAGYLFLKVVRKRKDFKYLGSVLIIATFFCTAPWILLNTSQQKGVERFRNLLELDPQKSRNGHYALAVYFKKKGLYGQVERENQAQERKFPALFLAKQGFTLLNTNQIDKAFEVGKKALDMDPALADAYRLLGKIYDSRESWDSAEVEFKTAINLKPGDPQMYADAGTHYLNIDSLDAALCYYHKALILGTKDALVYNNLGSIYSDNNNWKEAIRAYRKAIEIDPGFALPYYGLGIVFYNQGLIDQAISELEKASEVKPDFAAAHYSLACLYAQKGRREEAERELKLFSDYVANKEEVEKLKEQIDYLLKK
jgi:tetratricopeptide (TPR) repeat protein